MRFPAILSKLKEPLQRKGRLRAFFFRSRLPVSFPLTLSIEPTSRCNLSCVTCPPKHRAGGDMEWDLFRSLIDQSAEAGRRLMITLHKDGEPTLHPDLPRMVRYVKERRAARLVTFNTNGVALEKALSRELVLAGLDEIIVSLDTVDASTYRDLKGTDAFGRVTANVDSLMETRRLLRRSNPTVKVQILANLHALDGTLPEFLRQWKGRVDAVRVDRFTTWGGAVRPDLGKASASPRRYPCQYLWYTMAVNRDGAVSRCVYDWQIEDPVGDAAVESLRDIWNGEGMQRLREAHLSGEYPGVCSGCLNWVETDDMGPYLGKLGTAWG